MRQFQLLLADRDTYPMNTKPDFQKEKKLSGQILV